MANGKELQDRAHQLLEKCVGMERKRRKSYEQVEQSVFAQAAKIYEAVFNSSCIVSDVNAQYILRVQFCMKLARYGMQVTRLEEFQDEKVIVDSIIDSNVYAALMEIERQMSNESQPEVNPTE